MFKKYKRGILSVIERVKTYVPDIGRYQSHSFTESEIVVLLSNGTLRMPEEAAHMEEFFPKKISEDWIVSIGDSFKLNTGMSEVRNDSWLLRIFSS